MFQLSVNQTRCDTFPVSIHLFMDGCRLDHSSLHERLGTTHVSVCECLYVCATYVRCLHARTETSHQATSLQGTLQVGLARTDTDEQTDERGGPIYVIVYFLVLLQRQRRE